MEQDNIIVLPFLRNTNIENAVSTLNVAYKGVGENYPEDNDYDVYVKVLNEINDLISNIHGESQLIEFFAQDDKISDNKCFIKGINSIRQNSLRLTKIVNNWIELRKIEKNQTYLYVKNANIVEIIDNIVVNASKYIKDRIIFDTNIEEKLIVCDTNKLQKSILILLSTAIKHSNDKEIFINLSAFEDNVNINISFNNKNSKLLNAFIDKLDNPISDSSDELSLELHLCKTLITMHEGNIYVGGNGDEIIFTIELPCENSDSVYYLFKDDINYEYLTEQIKIELSDLYEI